MNLQGLGKMDRCRREGGGGTKQRCSDDGKGRGGKMERIKGAEGECCKMRRVYFPCRIFVLGNTSIAAYVAENSPKCKQTVVCYI